VWIVDVAVSIIEIDCPGSVNNVFLRWGARDGIILSDIEKRIQREKQEARSGRLLFTWVSCGFFYVWFFRV
jgi:hypothetical protein